MTNNGKIFGMIAIGFILLVFLGAIVGIINREESKNMVQLKTGVNLPSAKNQNVLEDSEKEVKIPEATGDVKAAADSVILETSDELSEITEEISESEEVFGSQEISDLTEVYVENDF